MIDEIQAIIEEIRAEFAPDARTAVFDVHVRRRAGTIEAYGAVSDPRAEAALRDRLVALKGRGPIVDRVARVPEQGIPDRPHALVIAAMAPMLAGPRISESHLSQIAHGNPALVLREYGRWLQCRASDGYIGWIHRGYVARFDDDEARAWETGAQGAMHVSLGARVVAEEGITIVRLPWGARVAIRDGRAVTPEGKTGEVVGEIVAVGDLPERFPPDGASIVATALRWIGSPYLWGGTTPSGVDCSGLAQSVFRVHGIPLPRDSDQQAGMGEPLPIDAPDLLRPGDLLFFEERRGRISHVAISMGGFRIVHSAVGNGGVARNDLASGGAYEKELRSLLVAARRITATEG